MWLGVDIGTSGVKAVLVDNSGAMVAEHTEPLSIQRPHALWSEQDPEQWWSATQSAILALPADLRSACKGLGLSGQMHGAVLLGADDNVLRPAILWNDGRSASQCAALGPLALEHTGNVAMPGFTAPKLAWLRENEPDSFAALKAVLLPKDYIRLRLTGEKTSEMSDASGTLWLDVAGRRWSGEMLAATGLDESQMPGLVEGSEQSGMLRPDIADDLGLPHVPVAGGGGDQAAGAIGAGVIDAGQAFLSLGTSGVIFAASDGFAPNPEQGVHAFCHALPGRWHVMSVMLSATACLDWVIRLTGFAGVPAALAAAEATGEQDDPPIFLPYLSGERTPHNDPRAKGCFFGLTHDTDPAALVDAVLEGVAFGLRDGLDALALDLNELSVIGGGSRSAYWAQILANALQVPLVYRDGSAVGPASGAARLARLAVTGETPEAVCTMPREQARYLPTANPHERLDRFRALYSSLQPNF
ncbi:xylulokinase [Erythrobacter ani]|uniref:Xylulose kinase n=1 Tax=Erythrobacter ani TaxID=2827235 RepID=A0ABS6SNQ7_9SPHN|nr:xylulokinase [Erythrobacter ani]MBV7266132.1 xylulokinase [Erythrobacter ani]